LGRQRLASVEILVNLVQNQDAAPLRHHAHDVVRGGDTAQFERGIHETVLSPSACV